MAVRLGWTAIHFSYFGVFFFYVRHSTALKLVFLFDLLSLGYFCCRVDFRVPSPKLSNQ